MEDAIADFEEFFPVHANPWDMVELADELEMKRRRWA